MPGGDGAGVLGTGVQARLQLEAAHLVRPFTRALVWGRDSAKAEAAAADLARSLGIEARPEPDPARLVAESQLVVTTTPARAPILKADWLHPGLHVTAMGSDQSEKNELDPRVLAAADLYVCDRVSQAETLGELRTALAAGVWTRGTPPELGAVVAASAWVAMAVSWAPVPVRSQTVIASGEGRPTTLPATTAPSSGGVPRVQRPAARAVRSSPRVSACETRSQT